MMFSFYVSLIASEGGIFPCLLVTFFVKKNFFLVNIENVAGSLAYWSHLAGRSTGQEVMPTQSQETEKSL